MIRETFDLDFIAEKFPAIIGALPVTLKITAIALLSGWAVGLIAAWGKVKGPKWLRILLGIVTDIIRGIPTVVLLYIVYFGLPKFADVSDWDKLTFVIIALTVELGTTSSEMFRSAYNSIHKGQLEAAHSLGFNGIQTFAHVIVPQGLYVILPNLGSAVLSIIQSTALVYTLGIFDILGKARQIDTNVCHIKTFEMYFAVAVIYWVLAILIQSVFALIEKQLSRHVRKVA